MTAILGAIVVVLTTLCRALGPGGTQSLIAENIVLRQQLAVVSRKHKKALNLRAVGRFILGLAAFFIRAARLRKIAVAIRPSTILRFHQTLVRRKYRELFTKKKLKSKPGPKGPSAELRAAIVGLKQRNPRFGCQRIAHTISRTFGIDIDKDVVRRVLARDYRPDHPQRRGPSWLTFLGDAKDSLWSVDLFRCESIILKSYWVMVIMDQYTRRIVGFGVQHGSVDGPTVCRMFNAARANHPAPQMLSTDNDPVFESHRWQANLRVLEIEELKTIPYVPLSHPFVERTIGTVRREFLDQTLFWNSTDLERKLACFAEYFNEQRVHRGLEGKTPDDMAGESKLKIADLTNFTWKSSCRGLVQLPIAA